MNANDIEQKMDQLFKDFDDCSKLLTSINLENLPLEIALKLLDQYLTLTKAIENFNTETKKLLVIASVMGRV